MYRGNGAFLFGNLHTTLQLRTLLTMSYNSNNRGNFGPRRLQYNIREFVNSGSSDNATNVVSAVKRMRLTQVGLGCQVPGTQGQPGCEGLCGGEVAQLEAPR